jgi:hypothetical protein
LVFFVGFITLAIVSSRSVLNIPVRHLVVYSTIDVHQPVIRSSLSSFTMEKDASKLPPKGPQKQRTIQVKIGGQSAKTMTPDQAADYLKQIAGQGAFGGSREMKLVSIS